MTLIQARAGDNRRATLPGDDNAAAAGAVAAFWRRKPSAEAALVAVLLILMIFLVVVPLIQVAVTATQGADGLSLRTFRTVLSETGIIRNTLIVSVGATIISLVIGAILAVILIRINVPGRALLEPLVVLPLYVTPLLTAIGWSWLGSPRAGLLNILARNFLGMTGPIVNLHSPGGVIFVVAMSSVPVAFLFAASALRSMDPSLEESARIHGGSIRKAFRMVTLPLITPALIGSGLLIFVHAMGLFSIPAVLGLPADFYVAGTEIYTLLSTYPQKIGPAAAWGFVLLAVTALLVWLQGLVLSKRSFVTITGKAFRPRIIDVGRARYLFAALAWAYLAAAVFLPIGALVWAASINFLTLNLTQMKFDLSHYAYILFNYPKTYQAAWNSLMLGVISATIVCVLGLAIGWVLVRARTRMKGVLDLLAMAPIAIPSMTFALGLLWLYVGMRWLPIYGTIGILVLAYVTHFLPYGVRAASGALRQMHPELEEAARVGGASWLKMIRFVTFPLTRPSLFAAWTLVFIMAIQEISASILLYTNRSVVLSVTIYGLWEQGNISNLAALAVLQLAFMFVVIAVLMRSRQQELI